MLYVTTREKFDAFTAPRTLAADCGGDGGTFVPYRLPRFTPEELEAMMGQSFAQTVVQLLDRFFSCRLNAWETETAIGRHPFQIADLGNRIHCLQLWHNLQGTYACLEETLAYKVNPQGNITSWLRIAIRICVLFGVFGQYRAAGALKPGQTVDLAVPGDDFLLPMAGWYCREMGLPIGTVICGCQNSSLPWELLHLGDTRLEGDSALLRELERLIFGTMGAEEAVRFGGLAQCRGSYKLLEADAERLRQGMFCAMVSPQRVRDVIPSVYRTNGCSLSPDAALSYAALMDYRAKTGTKTPALLLEDSKPAAFGQQ